MSAIALLLIVDVMNCSTPCHAWDAFRLALASFRLYCVQNNVFPSKSQKGGGVGKLGPRMLGDPPIIDVASCDVDLKEEENSSETVSSVNIYDDGVNMRFLVCGVPSKLVGLNNLVLSKYVSFKIAK